MRCGVFCASARGLCSNTAFARNISKAIDKLNIVSSGGIPDMRRVSDILERTTGWKLVTVPGLIPGSVFLEHLSKRQFATTWWLRDKKPGRLP